MDPAYAALDAPELFRLCAERRAAMDRVYEECTCPRGRTWIKEAIARSDAEEGAEIARTQSWVEHEGGVVDVDVLSCLAGRLNATYEDILNLADEDC